MKNHQPSEGGSAHSNCDGPLRGKSESGIEIASNNARQARGRPFQKGNRHGCGRPEGSRNKSTIALQQLLNNDGELLVQQAIKMAMNGDSVAMRLCLERLLPVARDRQIKIRMPRIESAQDVVAGISTVMAAVASGEITPSEGERMARLMEAQVRAIQIADAENHSSGGAPSGRLIAGTFSLYSGTPEAPPQPLPEAVDSMFAHDQPPVFPVPPVVD